MWGLGMFLAFIPGIFYRVTKWDWLIFLGIAMWLVFFVLCVRSSVAALVYTVKRRRQINEHEELS
jgi:hypothetical protein